jgi:hypothetical protein
MKMILEEGPSNTKWCGMRMLKKEIFCISKRW